MIGRARACRATVLNPKRSKVEAYPVCVVLGDNVASSGYASTAGAPTLRATSSAASIRTAVTPRRRWPLRT